jgi:hypothetical protein
MRRDRALKRGRWLSLLLAGFVGYLVGDWHAVASRPAVLSASQSVAFRFPEATADATVTSSVGEAPTGTTVAVLGDRDLALLNPERMVPQPRQPLPQAAPAAAAKSAASEDVVPAPVARPLAAARPKAEPKPEYKPEVKSESRAAGAATNVARTNRPGFLLNDAQIASIKERLHLSEDQERMWPAVEAALRNVAYARAHDPRRHGGAVTDVASLDPDSAEVQGLKSAAVPLIMSFNDDQKNEVKSLAHVMGLDRLASEF